jgi:hypothetical protein
MSISEHLFLLLHLLQMSLLAAESSAAPLPDAACTEYANARNCYRNDVMFAALAT